MDGNMLSSLRTFLTSQRLPKNMRFDAEEGKCIGVTCHYPDTLFNVYVDNLELEKYATIERIRLEIDQNGNIAAYLETDTEGTIVAHDENMMYQALDFRQPTPIPDLLKPGQIFGSFDAVLEYLKGVADFLTVNASETVF